MATNTVSQIVSALKNAFDPRFKEIGQKFEKIDQKLELLGNEMSHLPTKDEFYDKMDEVVTELQKTRDEQIVMSSQIDELDDGCRL